MGLLIGLGDYGIGDIVARAEALYELLLDLCQDQLSWEAILNKPPLYEKSEVYNKEEIDEIIEGLSGVDLPIEISDVAQLAEELAGRYTKGEIDALLLTKANKVHTHVVADIEDFDDYITGLGVQIVPELPTPVVDGTVYLVAPSGGAEFQFFLGLPGGGVMALDAITASEFATGLAAKQNKLIGPSDQVVMADGSYGPFNKAAIGLSDIPNLHPLLWPISNAVEAALLEKADANSVLFKDGNQTKTSGVLTFAVSPKVPEGAESDDAVNLGQVQGLIDTMGDSKASLMTVDFLVPATEWVWEHGLGYRPSVEIIIDGEVWFSKIAHENSDNRVRITFNSARAGSINATV